LMFSSIKQGLFLINPEYKIGSQYTSELKTMFQIDDLEGMNFIGILQRLLPEKMYRISRDYMEMMFDPTKKEKALITVNPLNEIEVNFSDPKGGFITKFFEFSFRRILNPDRSVHRVFITVRDTTKQAQLTRQLHESEKKKERQFELLFAILHVEGGALQSFTQSTRQSLEEMNQELKAEDFVGVTLGIAQDAMLRQRLDSLFRKVHIIKGTAAAIGLDYFINLSHEIESKIQKLKTTPKLSGEDFLGIVLQKSEMKAALDEIDELSKKLIEMKSTAPALPLEPNEDPLQSGINKLLSTLQLQTGKKARVEFQGFNQKAIPQKHLASIRDVVTQLIRNSFAHGIESEEERIKNQKDSIATLLLSCSPAETPGHLHISFRDDGQGLDIERIRSICIRKGFITPEQNQTLSNEAMVPYIFHSGFSTQAEPNTLSGRGVGLDIVSNEIITKIGGNLFVNFEKGEFCEFIMEIPV
jgi:two-component system, chemotaxis family, sensor kinase CheA